MAGSIQSSTASIGAAPSAGASTGELLPSLTSQVTGGGGTDTGAAQTGAAQAGTTPVAAAAAGGAAPKTLPGWLAPAGGIATLGGIGLVAHTIGGKAGIEAAEAGATHLGNPRTRLLLGSLGVVGGAIAWFLGSKAKTAQKEAAMQQEAQQGVLEVSQAAEQAIQQLSSQNQQLAAQLQAAQQAQQQQASTGSGGTSADGTTPTPGSDGGGTTGGTGQTPVGDTSDGSSTGSTGSADGSSPQPTAGPGAMVGTSVTLAAGKNTAGSEVVAQGQFVISAILGDANGYASVEAANAAAHTNVSTETMGSRTMRWLVVEHGGKYYAASARQLDASTASSAPAITAEQGNVVAWSGINYVYEGANATWQNYTWSQTGGAASKVIPDGTAAFPDASAGVGAADATAGATNVVNGPGTGTGTTAGGGAVTGGGATAATTAPTTAVAFDPTSALGRSFAINASATADGSIVRGGVLQIQQLSSISTGGFGTPEEAAVAARAVRAQSGSTSQWDRWVTLQGGDGRFYVYEGSLVNKATAPLSTAAPMHVFANGIAEYYDGTTASWKAQKDS